MIKDQNAYKRYLVRKIKEAPKKKVNKKIGGKLYKNASKLRIYKQKKQVAPVKRTNTEYIKQILALYKSMGIAKKEHQKAMSCLLYRFKRCNPYYNMLVTLYLEDYSRQDFFNMCYMITYSNDATDFKSLYKELQIQLETELVVTRKQKAKQVYKELSINSKDISDEYNYYLSTTNDIDHIDRKIDTDILYIYLKENCTKSQFDAIKLYLTENKPFDTRQKRRIIDKLKASDLKMLLY